MHKNLWYWCLCVAPLLFLWVFGDKWNKRADTTVPDSSHSFPSSSAYLLITNAHNSISWHLIQQVQPATVYVAYPPSEEQQFMSVLQRHPTLNIRGCHFDAKSTAAKIRQQARACQEILSSPLNGIVFNAYGVVGDGTLNEHANFVAHKVLGNLAWLHLLLEDGTFQENARILFLGSESARGLPKMGFPVPNLGTSIESIQAHLTGSIYSSSSSYRWEHAYGDLSAILVLYIKHLAKLYPQYYFGVISPGMTQESFNPNNAPNPTWTWRFQLWMYRTVLFPMLERAEIAKTSHEGARLLVQGLVVDDWKFPSGTFVGAQNGTGGPICDQSTLEGGQMFRNETLQELAFQAVQAFIPTILDREE